MVCQVCLIQPVVLHPPSYVLGSDDIVAALAKTEPAVAAVLARGGGGASLATRPQLESTPVFNNFNPNERETKLCFLST